MPMFVSKSRQLLQRLHEGGAEGVEELSEYHSLTSYKVFKCISSMSNWAVRSNSNSQLPQITCARVLWLLRVLCQAQGNIARQGAMLDSVRQHDRPASPVRNSLESDSAAQGPVVQKRLRSPRPAKKRQGLGAERAVDPAVATCSYGDDAVNGLSQLSDLVILDASQDANLSQDYPAEVASQQFLSQEGHDAPPSNSSQVMLEAPPSQPDIPLASLVVSSAQTDPPPETVNPFPTFSLPVQQSMVPQRLSAMSSSPMQELKDPNLLPLHPKSRATRRGPMDEMRQLVR